MWYFDLKSAADSVDYTVIESWSNLRRIKLKSFELDALIGIELARKKVIANG